LYPLPGPNKINLLIDECNIVDAKKFAEGQGAILLDEVSTTTELKQLSETDPYFTNRRVLEFAEKVAGRVARRMARVLSPSWGAPKDMITEAIHFHLWSELCAILALRRVARVIAARARNKPVLVVLPKMELECLNLWHRNELGPLMLCWALQKRGCQAYLLMKSPLAGTDPHVVLHASPLALPPRGDDNCEVPKGGPIIAPEGMRGLDILLDEIPNASILAGSIVIGELPPLATYYLIGSGYPATNVRIRFTKTPLNDFYQLKQYSAEWPKDPLTFYFDGILGPHFPAMVERAYSLVAKAAITEAYVCDHLFLGSAILAHTVKERGGSVILWPHSANPSHVVERDGKYFDKIVVVTQEAKKSWKRLFPDKPITIQPRCMLPQQRRPREFKPSEPLTVVVFGGAHFLGGLPLLRIESHLETFRRFFSLGQSEAKAVCLKFKSKEGVEMNETAAWFSNNVMQGVEIETRAATQLDYPNMIFLTIGCGSTALLEGIACAVPCMIVREHDVEEYVDINNDVVPIGDVDFIWELIKRCQNPNYYKKLLKAQINWLSGETSAEPIGHAWVGRVAHSLRVRLATFLR
jgi:hypothetical protein